MKTTEILEDKLQPLDNEHPSKDTHINIEDDERPRPTKLFIIP